LQKCTSEAILKRYWFVNNQTQLLIGRFLKEYFIEKFVCRNCLLDYYLYEDLHIYMYHYSNLDRISFEWVIALFSQNNSPKSLYAAGCSDLFRRNYLYFFCNYILLFNKSAPVMLPYFDDAGHYMCIVPLYDILLNNSTTWSVLTVTL
jgi:hypothetical protein